MMEQEKLKNQDGYDSDGLPDVNPGTGKPDEQDGNSGDESEDRADIDENLVNQEN